MSVESTLPSRRRDRHGRYHAAEVYRRGGIRRRLRRRVARSVRRLVLVSALGMLGLAVLGAVGFCAAAFIGARLATRRVVVEGRSMVPTFDPADRLLVVRLPRRWPLRPGDVVALTDPREPDRLLVKRVTTVGERGVTVTGDNPAESTDSRTFGPVDRGEVWGLVCYRYAPRARAGLVSRRSPVRT